MIIQSLAVTGFRNLTAQTLNFHPRCNVFYGDNASGKTSLLEALYYLSHLRSFRQREFAKIIQEDHTFFRLVAKCDDHALSHIIGIETQANQHIVRIDADPIKQRSTLAKMLPCLQLDPETGKLLTDSPKLRRQFMDWGLFHTQADYNQLWQYYERVLKQRNSLIKQRGNPKLLDTYDELLANSGEAMTKARTEWVEALFKTAEPLLSRLVAQPFEWSMEYKKGFSGASLLTDLQTQREKDLIMGHTRSGPHRGDFILKANGHNVGEYLSRGQIKLASIALTLAQAELFQTHHETQNIILLMDDLSAELDKQHREILLEAFLSLNVQLFITCLEPSEFPELRENQKLTDFAKFKISTGFVQKMV